MAVKQIFEFVNEHPERIFSVQLSCLNEKKKRVHDLLSESTATLTRLDDCESFSILDISIAELLLEKGLRFMDYST